MIVSTRSYGDLSYTSSLILSSILSFYLHTTTFMYWRGLNLVWQGGLIQRIKYLISIVHLLTAIDL